MSRLVSKLMASVVAALICSTLSMSAPAEAAGGHGWGGSGGHPGGGFGGHPGGFGGFHGFGRGGAFHGFHGGGFVGRGFGPGYGLGAYPYLDYYADLEPICDFVWVKRIIRHKIVRQQIYTCE